MVEESFTDIWAKSFISSEDEEAGAKSELQGDNDRELLQKVYDKYGERLGGVTVDDMVSELLCPKPVSDTSPSSRAKSVQTDGDSQAVSVENLRSGIFKTIFTTREMYILYRRDSHRVLKMIKARSDQVNVTSEEVYAYLEAHFHNPRRVEVVVQELLRSTDERSRSSSPEIIEVKVHQNSKGKGGKGKKSETTALKRPSLIEDCDDVARDGEAKKKTKINLTFPVDDIAQDLADNFSAMFPQTPKHYILCRVSQLVGNEAAVNDFMEELLSDPNPPLGWAEEPTSESEPEVVIIEDEKTFSSLLGRSTPGRPQAPGD